MTTTSLETPTATSETKSKRFTHDICIVGGAGHVGLPLGIAFAAKGLKVLIHDINRPVMDQISQGKMPFIEYGADPLLEETIGKTLQLSSDPADIATAEHVIIAIGTPVDEYLNPKLRSLLEFFVKLRPHLSREQTIIIRSTIYPRTCQQVAKTLGTDDGPWHVAYCPERIAQGYAIQELKEFPQIVSGVTDEAVARASELFGKIAPKILNVAVEEAELVKLFSNAWRYIQFATANQFFMMADSLGIDFNRVRKAMVEGYGRAATLPTAGFAAGPCLLKDTMQLAAFNNNSFLLGHAAMMINEGLPGYLVENLRKEHGDLAGKRVGILGMAFKGDVDDTRDSLSYKLGKILRFHGADVRYSDEFASDPTFVSKEELVANCEIVIVAVPHSNYQGFPIPANVQVIDLWGVLTKEPKA